jgi:monofunctional biosynthetic peptidoglycan transglycosylase
MKNLKKNLKKWLIRLMLFFFGSTLFFVIFYRFIPIPITPLMVIKTIEQMGEEQDWHFKKDWVPLEKINNNFPLAVVAAEDQLFLEHNGFDLKAIEKAMEYNEKKKGKKIKGASTISQQTAKNAFLWPGRSWIRKGLEVYFTFLIEIFWSKERIMEVYLNIIEMGRGVYGAEAAAQYYYNKPADKLSASQCAAIAAVLPNPVKWSPVKPTPYISKKQRWILKQMGWLDEKIVFEKE